MLCFPADKPSERMETPFVFITEQPTRAWRWQLAASVLFSPGWTSMPAREMEAVLSVPVIKLESVD
jgi:hypothetical protein